MSKTIGEGRSSTFSGDNQGYDEDGNPVTVQAAQRLYHKNNNPVYFPNPNFKNHSQAQKELKQGSQKIQQLLIKAKFQQLNMFGQRMGVSLESDNQLADMPKIRMMQIQKRSPDSNQYPSQAHQNIKNLRQQGIDERNQVPYQLQHSFTANHKKSSLDYEQMNNRIQKILQGEIKEQTKICYDPASPHHKFDKSHIALRKVYKEICKNNRHSIQYDDIVNSKEAFSRKNSHFKDLQKLKILKINEDSLDDLRSKNNYQFSNSKNDSILRLNLTHNGSFIGESNFNKTGFNLNKSSNIQNISNKFNDTVRIDEKLKLPLSFFGGNKFHSKYSNWDPNQSTLISQRFNYMKGFKNEQSKVFVKDELNFAVQQITERQLSEQRIVPTIIKIKKDFEEDVKGPELFTAQPSEEIPRNKLTEKYARGLQAYIQKIQKKESFFVELTEIHQQNWLPAPREYSTLASCQSKIFLIGGQNYDTNKEIAQLQYRYGQADQCLSEWKNVNYMQNENIQGRCRHSSITYNQKVYTFGGCFMFNKKRQLRECVNQLLVFDPLLNSFNVVKTKGINVMPRRDHCAALYSQSMIVYGGQFQNGQISSEILSLDLDFLDWSRIQYKQTFEPLIQAKCASVYINKKQSALSDSQGSLQAINDGIYYFGGKNAKGELQNKIRYLKPTLSDGKVIAAEWQKIKQNGNPPCPRVGHTIEFLPISQALIVVGGRNDQMCKSLVNPFLDDMYLFLLDQKSWLQVKYLPSSQKICRIGNHSMVLVADDERQERLVIFGGITNLKKGQDSSLGNQLFVLEIFQII